MSIFVIVVQLLSCVRLFSTPWTVARQASLSLIISLDLLKLLSIESVVLCNRLILSRPLLLLPLIFPSIRVFSNELALRIRWPKYWSFSSSIGPSNEYSGLISCRNDWLILQSKELSSLLQQGIFSNAKCSSAIPCILANPAHSWVPLDLPKES